MNIVDRSAIEVLYHACVTDNIEVQIGIYQKGQSSWLYVPPGQPLEARREYKAVFRLTNIGVEIDFKDCELRIKKTDETLPIKLYQELGQTPVERVDFNNIPWLRSDGRSPDVYRNVYFVPEGPIAPDARNRLFRVGVYGTIIPQGHHWGWANQETFSAPKLQVPDRVDFGEVSFTRTVVQTIGLGSVGEGDVTITGLTLEGASDFAIRGNLPLPCQVPKGQSVSLGVGFSPSGLGEKRGTLTVQSTDPANPTASIRLLGQGVHAFRFTPDRIDFGEVTVSQSRMRQVQLQNDGQEDVMVTDIAVTSRFFSCGTSRLTVGPGQILTLDILFSPPGEGTWTGMLTGVSSYAANPRIEVGLTGKGLHWLRATPDPVDFGLVAVGHRSSLVEVRVTNRHASPCEITGIAVAGEGFGNLPVYPGLVEVSSGQSLVVTSVWAQPVSYGLQEGQLRITHRLKGAFKSLVLAVRLTVRGR